MNIVTFLSRSLAALFLLSILTGCGSFTLTAGGSGSGSAGGTGTSSVESDEGEAVTQRGGATNVEGSDGSMTQDLGGRGARQAAITPTSTDAQEYSIVTLVYDLGSVTTLKFMDFTAVLSEVGGTLDEATHSTNKQSWRSLNVSGNKFQGSISTRYIKLTIKTNASSTNVSASPTWSGQ